MARKPTAAARGSHADEPARRHRRAAPWIVPAAVLAVVAGLIGAWSLRHGESEQGTRLVLHGHIDVREARPAFEISGRVVELAVDEGAAVKAGQPLARLEAGRYGDAVAAAAARWPRSTA